MPYVLFIVHLAVIIWLIITVQGLRTELASAKERLARLEAGKDRHA
jgi:hypothetical protein